jgi:tetratricopeptide (TPR) repeat protein
LCPKGDARICKDRPLLGAVIDSEERLKMTRPTRLRILYGVVVVLLIAFALSILKASKFSPTVLLVLGLLFLIPGRINGHFWRDFYTGRRMMDSGWNAEAIRVFEKFLVSVRENPTLKYLIWFVWSFYTRDVEAMTQNNIGAVLIRDGRLDQAEERLVQAIRIDDQYPIPYYNMALLAELRGDRKAASESLSTAEALGYRKTNIDEIANKAASILATIEGRKKRPSDDA